MKSIAEIEEAHDTIVGILECLAEVSQHQSKKNQQLICMVMADLDSMLDALCFALGHEENKCFEEKLEAAEQLLEELGYTQCKSGAE